MTEGRERGEGGREVKEGEKEEEKGEESKAFFTESYAHKYSWKHDSHNQKLETASSVNSLAALQQKMNTIPK